MTLKNYLLGFVLVWSCLLWVLPAQAADLYRFYSSELNGHFYTASIAERDALDLNSQWRYEGIAYRVSTPQATLPVYRFWSPLYKHHFFTASAFEKNELIANNPNWNFEGVAFTVATDGLPVYRFYSPVFKGHFYTTSEQERQNLEQNDSNWNFEGIAWYAQQSSTSTTLPALSAVNAGIQQMAKKFSEVDPNLHPGSQSIIYQVDQLTGDLPGNAKQSDKDLWEVIQNLAPTDAVKKSITEFEVYYNPGSGFSASVASVGGQLKQWRFSINYEALLSFEQVPYLVVHEHAHLLSYEQPQITTILNDRNVEQNCTTYFDDGFCFNAGSYINTHFQRFWNGTDAFIGRNRTATEALEYYTAHPSEFVSIYATTNVEEDFTETLAAYVFQENPNNQSKSSQKMSSLEGYVSLSSYRQKVREVVSNWADEVQ